jgi:ABC-type transport system involved in multi-copper enzyme maturation permease subunit
VKRTRWHNVAALLAKDIKLHWAAFLVLALFEVFTFTTMELQFPPRMRQSGAGFLQGVASIGTFIMAYRSIAAEEASKTISFLKSLPLSNGEIFGTKFLFMGAYVLANAAILNTIFCLARPYLPPDWAMNSLTARTTVLGLAVQLVFAVILVAVATLASSEKAIWVPFPFVIVILNLNTMLSSDNGPLRNTNVITAITAHWIWATLAIALLLAALITLVLWRARHKTTLIV